MTEENKELNKSRKIAERHWAFTEKLLRIVAPDLPFTLLHYLYVESWVHGVKHALDLYVPSDYQIPKPSVEV